MKQIIFFLLAFISVCQAQVKAPKYATWLIGSPIIIEPTPIDTGDYISFSYTPPFAGWTSAGIYNSSNQLLRTLWGDKYETSTLQTKTFAALTDDMATITSSAGLHIKVKVDTVKTTWEGGIGNSSLSDTGETVYKGWKAIEAGVVVGDTLWGSTGYSEKLPSCWFANNSNPNATKTILTLADNTVPRLSTSLNAYVMCSDGVNIYYGGNDSWSYKFSTPKISSSMIYAIRRSNISQVNFTYGIARKLGLGHTYASVIAFKSLDVLGTDTDAQVARKDSLTGLGGMAVQISGNFLFVSYPWSDTLKVFNKTTGQLLKSTFINRPKMLAVDGSDKLWMVSAAGVQRFSVDGSGNLSAAEATLSGISSALAIGCDRVNNIVAVNDSDDRVKAFSSTTASSLWALGTANAYAVSPRVSDKKFCFSTPAEGSYYKTFITFASDGSFWVGDPYLSRAIKFDASQNVLDKIQFVPKCYSSSVNEADSSSLFANFIEYKRNYSIPTLTATNGSWYMDNFWGRDVSKNMSSQYQIFKQVVTFSNSRVYATLVNTSANVVELVELVADSGIRYTGITFSRLTQVYPDGSLRRLVEARGSNIGKRQQSFVKYVTGYSGRNPVWGSESLLFETPNTTLLDPIYNGNSLQLATGDVTAPSNYGITNNGQNFTQEFQYHLGAVDITNPAVWKWRAMMSTTFNYSGPFPDVRYFDVGNTAQTRGTLAMVNGEYIATLFVGEFYRGFQTAMIYVYHSSGLPIKLFGTVRENTFGYAAAGVAGNAFSPSFVRAGSNYFIYMNDEGQGGKLQSWLIQYLNSVTIQNVPFTLIPRPSTTDIELMATVPRSVPLENGKSKWVRTPAANTPISNAPHFYVATGEKSYDRFEYTDISADYNATAIGDKATINYDLGAQSSASWDLNGELLYDNTFYNRGTDRTENGLGGQFLQVLDADNKVICRIYPHRPNSSSANGGVYMNDLSLFSMPTDSASRYIRQWRPLNISLIGGQIVGNYGEYNFNVPKYDVTADATKPKTVQLYFFNNNAVSFSMKVAVKQFVFKQ